MRIAGLMILVAGCFPPSLGEGKIACGNGGACPPGYLCRADNRCYSTSGGGSTDLSVPGDLAGSDGGGSHDLAGTTTSTDMATGSTGCSSTVPRVCTDAMHSAICVQSGGTWQAVADRTCPMGSMCGAGGHCQPPAGAMQCSHNGDCSGQNVCVEYAVGTSLLGYCTAPSSAASGGNKCPSAGFYDKCATGVCATAANDTTIHGCLNPCRNANDCATGKACDGVGAPMSIEGGDTNLLHFCAP